MSQGVYALIIKNEKEHQIHVGRFGSCLFPEGLYVYIGSALGKTSTSLEHRLKRHLSHMKKLFWHIDYFLNSDNVKILSYIYAYTIEPKECKLASAVSQICSSKIIIPNFGASDCKINCGSHLFCLDLDIHSLINLIKSIFSGQNLKPILQDTDNDSPNSS